MRVSNIFNNKAQSIMEYAIIIGLVVAGLSAMQVYIRRGIQAGIKVAADELGNQEDAEIDPTKGTKESSDSKIRTKAGGKPVGAAEVAQLSAGEAQKIILHQDGSQDIYIYRSSKVRPYDGVNSSYSTYISEEE